MSFATCRSTSVVTPLHDWNFSENSGTFPGFRTEEPGSKFQSLSGHSLLLQPPCFHCSNFFMGPGAVPTLRREEPGYKFSLQAESKVLALGAVLFDCPGSIREEFAVLSIPHWSNTSLKDATTFVKSPWFPCLIDWDVLVINSPDILQGQQREMAFTALCQRVHTLSLDTLFYLAHSENQSSEPRLPSEDLQSNGGSLFLLHCYLNHST